MMGLVVETIVKPLRAKKKSSSVQSHERDVELYSKIVTNVALFNYGTSNKK